MNKDTIIGFVLIAVVLIGFSWYNQPSAEESKTVLQLPSRITQPSNKNLTKLPRRLRQKQLRPTLRHSSLLHSLVTVSPSS